MPTATKKTTATPTDGRELYAIEIEGEPASVRYGHLSEVVRQFDGYLFRGQTVKVSLRGLAVVTVRNGEVTPAF